MLDDIEEQKAAEAIKIDSDMYQFLTEEILDEILPLIFKIGPPEGDFIERFDQKVKDGGIAVKEDYINQLWETKKQVPGVDLRSGEYGIEYAGMGFFHAGLHFFQNGDMENALANLEKAIELCPRNVLARSIKMQIHEKNRHFWLTAAEAGNSILLNPVSIAEKDSASREVLENYFEDMSDIFEEILVHAYYTRGTAFYNLEKYEEALADYNEMIRRNPNILIGIEMRQGVYMQLERWEEALVDGETLITARYEPDKIHQYQGIILRMMERYRDAIEELTTAISINPDLMYAYLHRSICNAEEDLKEEAVNDADEAVKRNVPYAHYHRAKAYLNIGEYTKAIADFDIAFQEDPEDDSIKNYRATAVNYKERGMITVYHRKNEKGEWEQVENRDGEILRILPSPNYEEFLEECRREEDEERRLAVEQTELPCKTTLPYSE